MLTRAQELAQQIRRNSVTIWTPGSAIGMIAAGGFGLLLVLMIDAMCGWSPGSTPGNDGEADRDDCVALPGICRDRVALP